MIRMISMSTTCLKVLNSENEWIIGHAKMTSYCHQNVMAKYVWWCWTWAHGYWFQTLGLETSVITQDNKLGRRCTVMVRMYWTWHYSERGCICLSTSIILSCPSPRCHLQPYISVCGRLWDNNQDCQIFCQWNTQLQRSP